MTISFDAILKVLDDCSIRSAAELRERLAGSSTARNTSSEWHDGYQHGFIKANDALIQDLKVQIGKLGSRAQILEREVAELKMAKVQDVPKAFRNSKKRRK